MSVPHFVDRPHRLVVRTFSGEVTRDQIAACTKLRHDRNFRPDYRQLADLSQVSHLKLYLEDLNSISSTYDPFFQGVAARLLRARQHHPGHRENLPVRRQERTA